MLIERGCSITKKNNDGEEPSQVAEDNEIEELIKGYHRELRRKRKECLGRIPELESKVNRLENENMELKTKVEKQEKMIQTLLTQVDELVGKIEERSEK